MTEHQKLVAATSHHRYALTRDDFLLLERSGAFRDYTKTELVEGTIYAVNAQFARHARVHGLLYQALVAACAGCKADVSAWIELTVALSDRDMPQPDILATRFLPDEGPVPAEAVALVIEVADASLDFDLDKKLTAYAAAGIPEYWVADVNARVIHQMWMPEGETYAECREIGFGESIPRPVPSRNWKWRRPC